MKALALFAEGYGVDDVRRILGLSYHQLVWILEKARPRLPGHLRIARNRARVYRHDV